MEKVRDGFSKTPSWCIDSDCHFYDDVDCNSCRTCTYCGLGLGDRGGNMERAHFFLAASKGGKTFVPACGQCNKSQGTKTVRRWIMRIKKDRPSLYRKIRDYQENMFSGKKREAISKNILDVD